MTNFDDRAPPAGKAHTNNPTIIRLRLSQIHIDRAVQQRIDMTDPSTVARYTEDMANGAVFPPAVVFRDGERYILAGGFHRIEAATMRGAEDFPVEVHEGGLREAVLYAVGANTDHGLQRSHADKRKAVTTLLSDQEWARWSDREIGRLAGVSHTTVATIREELSGKNGQIAQPNKRRARRGDQEYDIDLPRRRQADSSTAAERPSPSRSGSIAPTTPREPALAASSCVDHGAPRSTPELHESAPVSGSGDPGMPASVPEDRPPPRTEPRCEAEPHPATAAMQNARRLVGAQSAGLPRGWILFLAADLRQLADELETQWPADVRALQKNRHSSARLSKEFKSCTDAVEQECRILWRQLVEVVESYNVGNNTLGAVKQTAKAYNLILSKLRAQADRVVLELDQLRAKGGRGWSRSNLGSMANAWRQTWNSVDFPDVQIRDGQPITLPPAPHENLKTMTVSVSGGRWEAAPEPGVDDDDGPEPESTLRPEADAPASEPSSESAP
jgi:hypothetical protein